MPPAPGLFSMITVQPVRSESFVRDQAREDVVAAAGREADDHADHLVGVVTLRAKQVTRKAQRKARGATSRRSMGVLPGSFWGS